MAIRILVEKDGYMAGLFQCKHTDITSTETRRMGEVVLCLECMDLLDTNVYEGVPVEFVEEESGDVVLRYS